MAKTVEPTTDDVPEEDAPVSRRPTREVLRDAGTSTHDVSAFVLALLAWSWIGLPFIKNGPAGVKAVLRAKFFNKGGNGEKLP